ncbi:MAG: hypothetical protein ACE5JK_06235 [Candidatus Omnitrophota bacterium]
MKKLFLSVLVGAIISLCLVGCGEHPEHPSKEHPEGERAKPEHPKAERTKSEHPEAEHPK